MSKESVECTLGDIMCFRPQQRCRAQRLVDLRVTPLVGAPNELYVFGDGTLTFLLGGRKHKLILLNISNDKNCKRRK